MNPQSDDQDQNTWTYLNREEKEKIEKLTQENKKNTY